VALDRMDYIDKIERYLSDTDIYISLQRNPINKLIENLKKSLKFFSWLKKGYISSHIYSQINSTNAILPRAYGLPKIHKTDYYYFIVLRTNNREVSYLAIDL